jgi:hypothetical protein
MALTLKERLKSYFKIGRAPSEEEFAELIDAIPENVISNDIITSSGDLILGGSTGIPEKLVVGTDGQVLTSDGTTASWENPVVPIFDTLMTTAGDMIYMTDDYGPVDSHESSIESVSIVVVNTASSHAPMLFNDLSVDASHIAYGSSLSINVDIWFSFVGGFSGAWADFMVRLRRDTVNGEVLAVAPLNSERRIQTDSGGHERNLVIDYVDPSPTTNVYVVSLDFVDAGDNYSTQVMALYSNQRQITVSRTITAESQPGRLQVGSDGQVLTVIEGIPGWATPQETTPLDHDHVWADITDKPEVFPPDTHSHTLDSLSNVNAASPTDQQALIYDLATTQWIPGTVATTGGGVTLPDPVDATKFYNGAGEWAVPAGSDGAGVSEQEHLEAFLTSNVSMVTSGNTYYGPSLLLSAGKWLVNAALLYTPGTSQTFFYTSITDQSVIYATSISMAPQSTATSGLVNAVIDLEIPTTIFVSAIADQNLVNINGSLAGKDKISWITAIKLSTLGSGSTIVQSQDYICIQDQKAQGTHGGTFTSGAWQTRDLNTEQSDSGGHASVANNQITLEAGTYICRIQCPAYNVNQHQAKIYNITRSTDLLVGSNTRCDNADGTETYSIVVGKFVLEESTVIEIQHYSTSTRNNDGFGRYCNITTEIYSIAEFWKVEENAGSGSTIVQSQDYICIQDQKAQGTHGGTFTAGAWRTRDLNTEQSDTGNHASISSNQIILEPGIYTYKINAVAFRVGSHQARLQDITNSITINYGTSEYSWPGDNTTSSSMISGKLAITSPTIYEIQHRCETTETGNGFGQGASFGTEVYTIAEFWKVEENADSGEWSSSSPLGFTAVTDASGGYYDALTSNTLTDVDAAKMKVTFTAPASGEVLVRLSATANAGNVENAYLIWGIREGETSVINGGIAVRCIVQNKYTPVGVSKTFVITGLIPGEHTFKWAYSISAGTASIDANEDSQAVMEVWALGETSSSSGITLPNPTNSNLYLNGEGEWTTPFSGSSTKYLCYVDEKPASTNGGVATSNSWQTRTLNTVKSDLSGIGSLANNQVTLPAGSYRIYASVPFYRIGNTVLRIHDVTNDASLVLSTFQSLSPTDVVSNLMFTGSFTIVEETVIELQYHTTSNTGATIDLGIGNDVGGISTFSVLELWKLETGADLTIVQSQDYICIQDQKAQNTPGGTFTAGAWRTRDLNTEQSDMGNHVVVASNQITLQPGTYTCEIRCPALKVERHQARLYNMTASSTVLEGTAEYAYESGTVGNTSSICGKFTLEVESVLEVQHQCTNTIVDYGFGINVNFGEKCVFTVAEFWKVEENPITNIGGSTLLLDYRASTDIAAPTALPVSTWTDLGTNQTFTVTNPNAKIVIAIGGSVTVGNSGSPGNVGSRMVIDSEGTPINKFLSGFYRVGGAYHAGPFGGSSISVGSLSVGVHTVKPQIFFPADSTNLYCRPASQPEAEGLYIQVWQVEESTLGSSTLNNNSSYLTSDVILTDASSFFDGPSLTLGPGIWLINSGLSFLSGLACAITVQLWDGTNVFSNIDKTIQATNYDGINISGIVSIDTETNVKVSVRNNQSNNLVIKTTGLYAATNKSSWITAVKIG